MYNKKREFNTEVKSVELSLFYESYFIPTQLAQRIPLDVCRILLQSNKTHRRRIKLA